MAFVGAGVDGLCGVVVDVAVGWVEGALSLFFVVMFAIWLERRWMVIAIWAMVALWERASSVRVEMGVFMSDSFSSM